MSEPAERGLLAALDALATALRTLDAPSMIIGGIAVIARGIPRQTVDIDATVWAEGLDLDRLFGALAAEGIEPRIPDARGFARQHQVLLLRHPASGTPLEVSLAWLPFEREALARASTVDFGGVTVSVALPEDLIIFKAVAWRDRDRADIERLLVRYGDQVDMDRIRALVAEFADVLETPDRPAAFDALVTRARGGPGRP